jgi:hypothetical protein
MAKGLCVGVSNVARKVKKAYVGVGDVARKVKKIYIGVNGVARLAYASGPAQSGQVIFTSSQIWTVPADVDSVQVFLVGGGGSYINNGAGSGYTLTQTVDVVPGSQISILVGAGGAANDNDAHNGSASYFGNVSVSGNNGTNGGSGGGAYGRNGYVAGAGGTDGSGGQVEQNRYNGGPSGSGVYNPGAGQGFTTRAFGEATGTLYAGGGGGFGYNYDLQSGDGYYSERAGYGIGGAGGGGGGGNYTSLSVNGSSNYMYATAGTPNTGGGGGGGYSAVSPRRYAAGGSGIVIVRWFAS